MHPTELPCLNPAKRAKVDFPESLLLGGGAQPVMYSGYVNVTEQDFLFYWFAEAQAGADPGAPLIVWSNGGPGCSAMEGMTTEHGPLILFGVRDEGGTFPGKLSENPYSWNRNAHVLYVDQPRYVGYSCGTGPAVTSSEGVGKDFVAFLRGWRRLFPEHSRRELILASESYGGRYVAAWYAAMADHNSRASDEERLTTTGIILGNGLVDEAAQGDSFTEFARRQGLIPEHSAATSSKQAREMIAKNLGYQPNYYDYRLREKECCGCSSYNYKAWGDWLLREDVAKALNVCGDAGTKAFGGCAAGCISLPDFDKDSTFNAKAAVSQALDDGVKVTLYYGMQDMACNYVGGYFLAASLRWRGSGAFRKAPFEDLAIGGMDIGKLKSWGGLDGGKLTYLQVDGAGHMVPINSPAAATFAIGTLLPPASGASCLDEVNAPHVQGKSALQPLRHLLSVPSSEHVPAAELAVAIALAGVVTATLAAALRRQARGSSAEQELLLLD